MVAEECVYKSLPIRAVSYRILAQGVVLRAKLDRLLAISMALLAILACLLAIINKSVNF